MLTYVYRSTVSRIQLRKNLCNWQQSQQMPLKGRQEKNTLFKVKSLTSVRVNYFTDSLYVFASSVIVPRSESLNQVAEYQIG